MPISTRLILPVSSLLIDRIDRLLNHLVVIVEQSHVLILWATERDLSGAKEVPELINIRWTMVRRCGISECLVGCKDSKCWNISAKCVRFLPWNMLDIEKATIGTYMGSMLSLYTLNMYASLPGWGFQNIVVWSILPE